jgi:hypothetical protein
LTPECSDEIHNFAIATEKEQSVGVGTKAECFSRTRFFSDLHVQILRDIRVAYKDAV